MDATSWSLRSRPPRLARRARRRLPSALPLPPKASRRPDGSPVTRTAGLLRPEPSLVAAGHAAADD